MDGRGAGAVTVTSAGRGKQLLPGEVMQPWTGQVQRGKETYCVRNMIKISHAKKKKANKKSLC